MTTHDLLTGSVPLDAGNLLSMSGIRARLERLVAPYAGSPAMAHKTPTTYALVSFRTFQQLIQESDPNDCCWGYTTTLRREPIHCWLRPAGMRPVCCEPATDESGNDDWLNVIHSDHGIVKTMICGLTPAS